MSKNQIYKPNPERPDSDFYPTPPEVTRALLSVENFDGQIWEPACGKGDMSKVLEQAGYAVYSSDLYDQGYGVSGINFLTSNYRSQNIVTNPPFNIANQFALNAVRRADKKVALLLRLAFLESEFRYKNLFRHYPPIRIYVFVDRVTMWAENIAQTREDISENGAIAFAWYVWNRGFKGNPEIHWIKSSEFK